MARMDGKTRRIEAYKQEDVVITMRVVRDNDRDDSQSDYCAGSFVDTVKHAISMAISA